MKNIMKSFPILILIVVSSVLLSYCEDDNKIVDPEDNAPSETNTGILVGTVTDMYNYGLEDVNVSAAGKSISTNNQGYFALEGLSESSKLLVTLEKTGYVTTQKILTINIGESTHLTGKLAPKGPTKTVSGGSGGNLEIEDVKFDMPANGFTTASGSPYTGTVSLTSKRFDPTTSSFTDLFPGDFMGVSQSGGTASPIESYGFIDAEITDGNGAELKIASGSTVDITFPIAPSMLASAPSTIPLFYYNLNTGEWIEDGQATKVGDYYEGSVSHFTSWNWDRFYDVSYIIGRVIDGDGNPVVNARVEAQGISGYSGLSYKNTDSQGRFRIGVKPNAVVEVTAKKGGVQSSVITVNPTAPDTEEINIGDIILAPPIGTITLTWDAFPEDLDSHLLIPSSTGGGSPGHVYYPSSNRGSQTYYPYAQLDTDDTDGNGPEIITIYKKYPGTYTYFVHNYDADGDAESDASGYLRLSGAKVNLVIAGSAYVFNVPSSNPDNKIVWRLFEIKVNDEGAVSINQLNDFVNYSAITSGSPLLKNKVK